MAKQLVPGNNAIVTDGSGNTDHVSLSAGAGTQIKKIVCGTDTLIGGTVVVSTAAVTDNSRIFLTISGGTLTNLGTPYVSARVAGTSFTISSTNILDVSDISWLLLVPV